MIAEVLRVLQREASREHEAYLAALGCGVVPLALRVGFRDESGTGIGRPFWSTATNV